MRSYRALLIAGLVAGTGQGCGGPAKVGPASAPLSGQAAADPADHLLAFVPPDASFVMMRDRQAGLSDQFSNPAQTLAGLRTMRAALDPAAGAGRAYVAALLDELLAATRPATDVLGWHEGESVLVVYGLGLEPVLRATLDGATLRATLERAATTSGFPLVAETWEGRPYYRIEVPTAAFTMWLVLRLDDHEVVAALTGDPDRLVAHVMAERPEGRRFDPAPIVAAAYPTRRREARFSAAIYPARLGAALGQVFARRPAWAEVFDECGLAAADLLAVTPAITGAWVPTPGAFEAVLVVDVADRTVDRLARDQRTIPRWPSDDDGLRVGLGVGPRTLIDVSEPWFAAFDRTAAACGSSGDTVASLRRALAPAPMALIDAAVVEYDPQTSTVVGALGARDPQALWAALRTLLPLRPQAPTPGEQLAMPGMLFLGGGDALGVAGGGGDVAGALTALMAAKAGPRELFAVELGRRFVEQASRGAVTAWADAGFTSMRFHGSLRERRLIIEMGVTLAAPARPQLAR